MTKLISAIVLLFLIQTGRAQNTYLDYKYAVKLYNLTTYEDYSKSEAGNSWLNFIYPDKSLQIFHPTFAFQMKTKKNNFHEFELTSFKLDKFEPESETKYNTTDSVYTSIGYEIFTTAVSTRYEFILDFNKSKDRKLVPSLGFGINPYYKQSNYTPKLSDYFPFSEKYIGARAYITPRLTCYFKSRIFIDLNIPLCLFDIYFLSDKWPNPTLPIGEQTTNTVSFEEFPKIFSVRFGIGLKL